MRPKRAARTHSFPAPPQRSKPARHTFGTSESRQYSMGGGRLPVSPTKFIQNVFTHNRAWVAKTRSADPAFFERLGAGQAPNMMWLGCADSRVPAAQLLGLGPGEVFVHRNVANVLYHSDMNALSVIQYAVEALKVKHIVVCGHFKCGGVQAAMSDKQNGLVDNWLRTVRDLYHANHAEIEAIPDPDEQWNRMCELNVMQQVGNVCHTTIVQNAWHRGEELSVHGWIYDPTDGYLDDLNVSCSSVDQVHSAFRTQPTIISATS